MAAICVPPMCLHIARYSTLDAKAGRHQRSLGSSHRAQDERTTSPADAPEVCARFCRCPVRRMHSLHESRGEATVTHQDSRTMTLQSLEHVSTVSDAIQTCGLILGKHQYPLQPILYQHRPRDSPDCLVVLAGADYACIERRSPSEGPADESVMCGKPPSAAKLQITPYLVEVTPLLRPTRAYSCHSAEWLARRIYQHTV